MAISQGAIGSGGPVGLSLFAWVLFRASTATIHAGNNVASVANSGNGMLITFTAAAPDTNSLIVPNFINRKSAALVLSPTVSAVTVNNFNLEMYDAANAVSLPVNWGMVHLSVWR